MILFVDDEKREMESSALELTLSGYEVSYYRSVDKALKFFDQNVRRIDLIILDVMMPPGSSFKDVDTMSGLRTGVHFYERIRKNAKDIPVIILTNVSDEHVKERFRSEKNCWFLQKEDHLPFQLAEEVANVLSLVKSKGEKS